MYPTNGRRATSRGALLAVLQSFLLLSVLVLTPASAIAQEGDATADLAPEATQPMAESQATPAPEQPGPTADKQSSKATDDDAKAEPKADAAPAVAEPELKLRLYPNQLKLFPGGKKVVSAWTCPADIGASFGPDKKPGTSDDKCDPVRATWSVEPADAARLSNAFGYKSRITLLTDGDVDVRAQADRLTGKGRVIAKEEPAMVRPQAVTIEPSAVEPVLEASVVEQPSAAPAEEPVNDAPAEEPVDEPGAEPSAAPVDEPSAAPSEEPIVEEPSAAPVDEPSAAPIDEPKLAARAIEPAAVELATASKMTLNTHEGQKSDGSYTPGNVTEYSELDFINFRFTITATGPATGTMSVHFTGEDSQCVDTFFTQAFYLGTHDSSAPAREALSGATPTVNLLGGVVKDGEDWRQDLEFVYTAAGETRFNYYLQLSKTAGECSSGSPQHSQVDNFAGDFGNTGEKTVPVPANKVLENPRVTAIKYVDRGNGDYVLANAGEFGFQLDGSGAYVPVDGDASVVFDPDPPLATGNHTVREQQLTGSDSYEFVEGSGTNCTFDQNGVATANVAVGQTAKNATCIFYNRIAKGTLIVKKVVVNDNGGDAVATDFAFDVAGPSAQGPLPFSQDGADQLKGKNTLSVAPGTYTVTESQPIVSGYSVSYDNCSSVVVAAGATQTCTITNDDDPAGLILKKTVINDNGGSAAASAWTLSAGAHSVTGSAAGALATSVAGTYALSESGPAGYSNTSLTCDNSTGQVDSVSVGLGQTVTCEFVNDDDAATLTLVKSVSGGSATADDFDAYIDAQLVTWGSPVDLAPGNYAASEIMNVSDYVAGEWGGDCDAHGNVSIALGDELTCTITNYHAELEIEKSADPGFYAEAGDLIDYTITATNTGMATLTDVDVSDALIDGLDSWECKPQIPATLAPGESVTCTASYEVTAADVEAGSVPNSACVVSDETSEPVCDDKTVYLSELEIVKSADVDYINAAGDQITYSVTATNTGEVTLTNVDISDALIDGLDSWECTPTLVVAELASGESITCTATYEVTEADVDAGSVPNSACAVSDQTPEVCDDLDIPLAQIEIEKTADPLTYSAVGDEIVYTVTATNTGVATLTDVDISDALIDGLDSWVCTVGNTVTSLPVAQLASGQVITCSATYIVTEADVNGVDPEGFITNVACVDSDQTPEVCDQVTTREIVVQLIKSVTPTTLAEPGGVFTYTLFIDNDSAVPVEITELVDDNSALSPDWDANCAILVGTTLAPDGPGDADSVTCSYTVERTDAGIYPNTAEVTVVDENGTEATAEDVAKVKVTDVLPQIVVTKTASTGYVEAPGADVDFTFVVENLSVEPVTITSLSDDVFGTLDGDADCQVGTVLGVGATCDFTQTFFVSGVGGELHVNVFTATADDDDGNQATDADDAEVVIQTPLEIVIQKTPSRSQVPDGGEVTFTFEFSHPLPFSLYLYALEDDVFGDLLDENNLGPQGDPHIELVPGSNTCANQDVGFELLPGATYTCELEAIISGNAGYIHQNTVEITATDIDPTVQPEPGSPEPRFTTWSDDATVRVVEPQITGDPRTPDPSQPPTDMLLLTDTSGDDQSAFGDPLSWAIWVLLSALLILSTGFVLRRQRFAEVRAR